jgi:hypothetical protein
MNGAYMCRSFARPSTLSSRAICLPGILATALVLGVWFAPRPAAAAVAGLNQHKALAAARAELGAPVIDGKLDDPAWSHALASDAFTQAFPKNGAAPSERTEVRVVYDDRAVYVGVRAFDSHPDELVDKLSRRDSDVETDFVAIGFDSRHSHSSAYVFGLSVAGVQYDSLFFNDNQNTSDWDAVWDGATIRDAAGWSAEFRIPLTVLRFSDAPEQVWGFDAYRAIPRLKENLSWSFVPQGEAAGVSRWGHLTGLRGLRPRRTVELRPYVATRIELDADRGGPWLGQGARARPEGSAAIGVDFKVGLSSALTIDGTVLPDFGQVEADPEVLNLSRFESFFPEKRPFFLEGSEAFEAPSQIYYSRRIGRPVVGLGPGDGLALGAEALDVVSARTAVDIWAATKLTGTLAPGLGVGLLAAVTGPEEVVARGEGGELREVRLAPPRSHAILRLRKDLGAGTTTLGIMATAVTRLGGAVLEPGLDHDAYVQAADLRYRSPSGRLELVGEAVVSERVGGPARANVRADGTVQGAGDVGVGAKLSVRHTRPRYSVGGQLYTLSPTLDLNDLGFVQQFNQHRGSAHVGLHWPKPEGAFVSRDLGLSTDVTFDWDGVFIDHSAVLEANAVFSNFWGMSARLWASAPGQWKAYETGDGAYLERAPYSVLFVDLDTDSRKAVVVTAGAQAGHALGNSGWLGGGHVDLALNAVSQLELSTSARLFWEANDLRQWFFGGCTEVQGGAACTPDSAGRDYRFGLLDSGTLAFTLRGSWTFSPTLSLGAYAELFMSQGAFHDRTGVRTMGRRPFIERAELSQIAGFDGDLDGDGVADDNFEDTALNVNVVLRWEVAPGSTLLGVYTRAQGSDGAVAGGDPGFRVSVLGTGPTLEVVMMKLVIFYGR